MEATSAQLTIAAAFAAAQQPALALPHALNALYHATALHLDVLAASATVALAEIKLCLSPGMAGAARALIEVPPPPPPHRSPLPTPADPCVRS